MKNLRRILCVSLIAAFIVAVAMFAAACTPKGFTVKFMANGSEYKSITVAEGENIEKPENPVIQGFEFVNWYTDEQASGTAVTFPVRATADVTYYAKLTPVYTVTLMNGTEKMGEVTGKQGTTIRFDTNKEGYLFEGWYTDLSYGTKVTSMKIGDKNVTYYAKYTRVYTMSFVSPEFEDAYLPQNITEKEGAAIEVEDPNDQLYMFLGWYDNADFKGNPVTIPSVMPAKDVTYYAKLAEKVTLYYSKHANTPDGQFDVTEVVMEEVALGGTVKIKTPQELNFTNGTSRFITWTTSDKSDGSDMLIPGADLELSKDKFHAGKDVFIFAQWADEYTSDADESAKVYVSATYFGENNAWYVKDGAEIVGKSYITVADDLEFDFALNGGVSFTGMVHGNLRKNDGTYHLRDYPLIDCGDYVKISRDGEVSDSAQLFASGYKYLYTYSEKNSATGEYEEKTEECTYGVYNAVENGEWYKKGKYFGLILSSSSEESAKDYTFLAAEINANNDLKMSFVTVFRFGETKPEGKSGSFVESGMESLAVLTYLGSQYPVWLMWDVNADRVTMNEFIMLDGFGGGTYVTLDGGATVEVDGTYTATEKFGGTFEGEWTFTPSDGSPAKTFWLQLDSQTLMGMFLLRDDAIVGEYKGDNNISLEVEGYYNKMYPTVYTDKDGTKTEGTYTVADEKNKILWFMPVHETIQYSVTDSLFFSYTDDKTIELINADEDGFIVYNNTLYAYFGEKTGTVEEPLKIPDGVTSVYAGAFNYLKNVVAVDLNDVTSIGSGAFYDCEDLVYVKFTNVTDIGVQAFYECHSLVSVELPKVVNIMAQAFANTPALESVEIGEAIETIEYNAFFCQYEKSGDLIVSFLGTRAPVIGEDIINEESFDTENGKAFIVRVKNVDVLKTFYAAPSWGLYRSVVVCDNINPSAYFGIWFADDLSAISFGETSVVDGSVVFYEEKNSVVTVYKRVESGSDITLEEAVVTFNTDKSEVTIGGKTYKKIAAGTKYTLTDSAGNKLEFTHSGTLETTDSEAIYTPVGQDAIPSAVGINNITAAAEIVLMKEKSLLKYYSVTVDLATSSFTSEFFGWTMSFSPIFGSSDGKGDVSVTLTGEDAVSLSSEALYGVLGLDKKEISFENVKAMSVKYGAMDGAGMGVSANALNIVFTFDKTYTVEDKSITSSYMVSIMCIVGSSEGGFYMVNYWYAALPEDVEDADSGMTLRLYFCIGSGTGIGGSAEGLPQDGDLVGFDVVINGEVVESEDLSTETDIIIRITEGEKAGTYKVIIESDDGKNYTVKFIKQ